MSTNAPKEQFVFYEKHKVGRVYETTAGSIGFQYDAKWLKSGFAISRCLPLTEAPFTDKSSIFFSNLLPEGETRMAVCRRLGISNDNDYSLLIAIGGECAGALSIGAEQPAPAKAQYEKIKKSELGKRLKAGETLFSALLDDEVRFSLAGAQDKLPVLFENDELFLPLESSASTHILKPPSRRFHHVPENEYLLTQLARKMGLSVAKSELIELSEVRALLIERYDRRISEKAVRRLHQEDFCQALGVSYKKKYEVDRGPSFVEAYKLIEQTSESLPEDLERIVQWLIFNVLTGNCDGHAKNLSFLRSPDGSWSLSPHYDLVSTRVYPKVSTQLAMSIGGTFDSGTVTGTHWRRLAEEIKFGSSLLHKMVQQMAENAGDHYSDLAREFVRQFGKCPILASLEKVIHQQRRRLLTQLKK